MEYDDLDRLIHVDAAGMWGSAAYTYDALDNLLTSSLSQGPTSRVATHIYDPATNRLTGITSTTSAYNFGYGYDGQGNISNRGGQVFTFDQGNRLAAAVGKATYGYDGLGHRVSVVGTDGVNRV